MPHTKSRYGDFFSSLWSCRNQTLGKTKPCLFRLVRGQLASAQRAGIETHRHTTHQHGRALLLDRHLGANRATGGASGRIRTEEACPLGQPLVESFRTVLPVLAANVVAVAAKRPVNRFESF
jgi:hypothetical protein